MKSISLFSILLLSILNCVAQGNWTTKSAIFSGNTTQSIAHLAIGSKAYMGMGTALCFEWYEYDPSSDAYMQKANFPDTAASNPAVFSINGYGFVLANDNHLWKYDPQNDSWINAGADFPGAPRYASYYFTIGSKGYVAGGSADLDNSLLKDFWEYNSLTNQWTALPDMPVANSCGEAFALHGKGFLTGGVAPTGVCSFSRAVYCYDPSLQSWTAKSNTPDGRFTASSFVIGDHAYLSMGITKDAANLDAPNYHAYEYDDVMDSWSQVADIPFSEIWDEGVGFSIDGKGYMGLGDCNGMINCSPGSQHRLFEFTPASTGISVVDHSALARVFPNPFVQSAIIQFTMTLKNAELKFRSITGAEIFSIQNFSGEWLRLERNEMPAGIYFLSFTDENQNNGLIKICITD